MEGHERVIGEEQGLKEILDGGEILPLLRMAVEAGASGAAVCDSGGCELWSWGDGRSVDPASITSIFLEGEQVGTVLLWGGEEVRFPLDTLAHMLSHTIDSIIGNKLKRMLTSRIHTTVVNLSHEDLVETNRRLTLSESRYRELAENLEKTVEERTGELKAAHLRLFQQEQMAAIGRLAAGVAHEVNNPLGFITSNLHTLRKYAERLLRVLEGCRPVDDAPRDGGLDSRSRGELWREMKMDLVCSDILPLIDQSMGGAERVKKIVADLKGFSTMNEIERSDVLLNEVVERTLAMVALQIPRDASIRKEYGPLPPVSCNPGLLCRVFQNILLNAFQSCPDGLRLEISTRSPAGSVHVSFTDNGPGIPPETRSRIFEPFYTTRDVGSGTGLGLTVAYDIVARYGGTIEVGCPDTGGSTFTVILPLSRKE